MLSDNVKLLRAYVCTCMLAFVLIITYIYIRPLFLSNLSLLSLHSSRNLINNHCIDSLKISLVHASKIIINAFVQKVYIVQKSLSIIRKICWDYNYD